MGGVVDFFEDVADTVVGFVEDIWEFQVDLLEEVIDFITLDWLLPDIPVPNSPTYNGSDRVANTISEGVFIARGYGRCKIGGNKIRFNAADASDLRIILAHCMGPVQGAVSYQVNDIDWGDLSGSQSKTEYTGTETQTADGRFTTDACAYRGIAYTAFTFEKNNKQIGSNPNITTVMDLLLCAPLDGGADEHTRCPGVIMYDWYVNVEGYDPSELDLNEFKSLEALCDAVPSGGTLPRYRFDYIFDGDVSINDAKKLIWKSFNGRCIRSQGKIKPVWDSGQMSDGAGGLTAKTVQYAFDMDNIVKDAFSWKPLERPNIVRIYFKDSDQNYKTSSVEVKDKLDIAKNGEILYEEIDWFITDREIASRRAKYIFKKKAKYIFIFV